MKWADELTTIRTALSDQQGNVWSEALLRERFNASIRDLLGRLPTTRAVATIGVPPRVQSQHCFDWESAFASNSRPCLRDQGGVLAFTASFEIQVLVGHASDAQDEGQSFTHPFEAWFANPPGLPVPFLFPSDFNEAVSLYHDEEPLTYDTRKLLQFGDPSWFKRTGEPVSYWRNDVASNEFYLYPLPSSIVWNDTTGGSDVAFAISAAFEANHLSVASRRFTKQSAVIAYIWDWEREAPFFGEANFIRGMWLFEMGVLSSGLHGMVLFEEGDTVDGAFGTMRFREITALNLAIGIDIALVESVDNLILVYSKAPISILGPDDEIPLPDYMVRYARFRTLGSAFKSKSDFQNDRMSQYWMARYELGITALKQFLASRSVDRDYRLLTSPGAQPPRRARGPRLPDSYPRV